jgi:hypothetical protein
MISVGPGFNPLSGLREVEVHLAAAGHPTFLAVRTTNRVYGFSFLASPFPDFRSSESDPGSKICSGQERRKVSVDYGEN